MTCETDTWTGCYDLSWKGIIVDAAMSHPAKYSRGLITRIIAHALNEGMIQPGQVVLDPFAGQGGGALPCLQAGLHYVGVELEEKFVTLARENIALWNDRYAAHFPNWGSAQIYQGDSRRLAEVVSAAGLVVGSPPYANSMESGDKKAHIDFAKSFDGKDHRGKGNGSQGTRTESYGSTPGQLATLPSGDISAVISSPPFAGNTGGRGEASRNGIDPGLFDRHSGGMKGGTGSDPANLDHLPMTPRNTRRGMGTPPMAIVSSPPYASARPESNGGGVDLTKQWETYRASGGGQSLEAFTATQLTHSEGYGSAPGQLGAMKPGEITKVIGGIVPSAVIASPPFADSVGSDDPDKRGGLFRDEKRRNDVNLTGTYGQTDGQLGGMKAGAVIGSPPYEASVNQSAGANDTEARIERMRQAGIDVENRANVGGGNGVARQPQAYGSTAGQIGATQGDTFWAAARLIVEQCASILPPNGVAIWVLKGYIKSGKYVDFPGQWQQLCEACGFETVHIHRAMLVKENGAQGNMFGTEKKNKVQRKSFFRLMFEAKQKAAKHWLTLGREDQAAVLWRAHGELWRDYWTRLALFELSDEDKEKAGVKIDMAAPTRPTRRKILGDAKTAAWARDGKIDYEIATSIDYETILCMRKAA